MFLFIFLNFTLAIKINWIELADIFLSSFYSIYDIWRGELSNRIR